MDWHGGKTSGPCKRAFSEIGGNAGLAYAKYRFSFGDAGGPVEVDPNADEIRRRGFDGTGRYGAGREGSGKGRYMTEIQTGPASDLEGFGMRAQSLLVLIVLLLGSAVADEPSPAFDPTSMQLQDMLDKTTQFRVSLTKAGEFELPVHRSLTPSETACAQSINRGHYFQDYLQQQRSAAHFDNCAIDDGSAYIRELLHQADGAFAAAPAGASQDNAEIQIALLAIGQTLHAIQDFYAHTNYIEMESHDSHVLDGRDAPIVQIWTEDGVHRLDALLKAGLVSGTWALGVPKRCSAGALTHAALNKDSNDADEGKQKVAKWGNRTLFQSAFATAERASVAFLQFGARRWPQFARACGDELDLIGLTDSRSAE
jgi:hypothetical protein